MMNPFANAMTHGAITQPNCDVIETDAVNKEWKNGLKNQMPEEIKDIMDAICQRLSKDGKLNFCKNNEVKDEVKDEVNLIAYMTTEIEKHIFSLFGGSQPDILHHLLHYIPTQTKQMNGGGGAGLPADLTGAGLAAGATGAAGAAGADGLTAAAAVPTDAVTAAAPPINTTKNVIENGKAKTILNLYTNEFKQLLKCDSNTTKYLKTKIIEPMITSIKEKLDIDKQELLGSIAKETTTKSIKKRIALIEPTINVYQNIISTAPAPETKTLNIILPDYLRLILELFVYNHYKYLLGSEKLTLTTVELSIHINKLKNINGINESLKGLTDNSVKKIIDLSKVPSPKTEKKDTEEETNNNEEALNQFIKLFEEPEETKGGGRKKHTRKKKRHHKKRRSTRRYR